MNKQLKSEISIKASNIEHKWFSDLISGLIGGLVSVTACAPLDIARTRLNMMNSQYSVKKYEGFLHALQTIQKEEGFRGFYKGYNATVISIPLFHSLFFTIYNQMKPFIKNHMTDTPLVIQHICASTITGFICDTLTNPLWVVRTRLQVQHMHQDSSKYSDGLFKTFRKIQQEEGFKALYKGLGASLLGLTHVAFQFPIYEYLKAKFEHNKSLQNKKVNSKDIFVASVISKFIACSITYPHIVIRTRLQDNRQNYGSLNLSHRLRIKDIVMDIVHKEGLNGLYRGLKVDLVRVLPANTITFIVYEYCKSVIDGQTKQQSELLH
ncbi:carrier protein (macronuclear) [Tetrahymena thermophila SB210]|uniref:Carrier protein n=1 Tax=Tetrahymena thermophila (strain SB210) TaxID=312017 RepID=I7LZR1_TETTS|nr:carrier protein [Tetrahymena thermophila SB210]EAR84652.2 carrier protein [Tetrahymena thermophila SB210]|eukprot:XP_001032315.2 carrier protein [Tetrahymena thermophila SB210]